MRNSIRLLSLYGWNSQLSGAFLFSLQVCEVVVRNAVAEVLETVYGPQWPWSQSFERSLPDPKFGLSLRKELNSARSKAPVGHTSKVVPEAKFAFWEKLFTQRFDSRLWVPYLCTAFPELPAGLSIQRCRLMIAEELEKIRGLRNRIAHHEHLLNRQLPADYIRIHRVISWRSVSTATWVDGIEMVTTLIGQRP